MIDAQMSLSLGKMLTDVLGRERSIEKVFPDGSFNCPFCTAAVIAPKERCENPWCPASSYAIAHPSCAGEFRKKIEAHEAEKAEMERRRRDSQAAIERAKEE